MGDAHCLVILIRFCFYHIIYATLSILLQCYQVALGLFFRRRAALSVLVIALALFSR